MGFRVEGFEFCILHEVERRVWGEVEVGFGGG